ncbi:MAG: aldo/keto reductase, partial [Erysipelotrichaceae bacterium]|nr:aldo/keto reductase [Erysipelotrichaceae bacterium]
NIQMESWSPLMRGAVLDIPLLQELSKKYNRSITQIVLRWNIQKGVVVIPKSVTPSRIKENFEIFDFKLEDEDIIEIDALNENIRTGADPDNFDF